MTNRIARRKLRVGMERQGWDEPGSATGRVLEPLRLRVSEFDDSGTRSAAVSTRPEAQIFWKYSPLPS